MSLWSFIAVCVVCGCVLQGYRAYLKSRKAGGGKVAELEARIAALEDGQNLEERVRTLEAIVTDPKFQLDSEIKQLHSKAP